MSLKQATRRTTILATCLLPLLGGCSGGGGGNGIPVTMTLTAVVRGPSQVDLDWTPYQGTVTGYDVFHNGVAASKVHINGTSFPDRGLEPGTTYRFVVNAVAFPLGVVGRSNEVIATTTALAPWQRATIDASAGAHVALALDSGGHAHVAYRGAAGLAYATNVSGAWLSTLVDATAGDGDTAIAVADAAVVHIAYVVDTDGSLRHATNGTGAWVTATVDAAASGGVAIAADSAGRAHASYASAFPLAQLMYATNAAGAWAATPLPGSGVTDSAIALDDDDVAHVAFTFGGTQDGGVGYLSDGGGTWTGVPLAANGMLGGIGLALDAAGRPHVCCATKAPAFALVHATMTGGAWTQEQVDSFDWFSGPDRCVVVDAADVPHLLYTNHNGDLVHAARTAGVWAIEYIDARAVTWCALAVDAARRLHAAYSFLDGNHRLRHAGS